MRILLGRNHAMVNRAAFGFAPLFTPTNFGEVALYNNSSGPHVIVVWDFTGNNGASNMIGFAIVQRALGTLVGPGQSIIAGEPAPIGQVYKYDLASADAIQADYDNNGVPMNATIPAPLAVLLPGWQFAIPSSVTNSPIGGTFWYQWLYAEEFGYNARTPDYEIQ